MSLRQIREILGLILALAAIAGMLWWDVQLPPEYRSIWPDWVEMPTRSAWYWVGR